MGFICIWQTVFTLHLFEESDFPRDCWQTPLRDPRDEEAPSCSTCGSPACVAASWLTTHVTLFLVLSQLSGNLHPLPCCHLLLLLQLPHTISFQAHLIAALNCNIFLWASRIQDRATLWKPHRDHLWDNEQEVGLYMTVYISGVASLYTCFTFQ